METYTSFKEKILKKKNRNRLECGILGVEQQVQHQSRKSKT
jgi:hypothetical protein